MLEAVLWGLIQGLTEFLPVSSSGHLRLLPEIFGAEAPGLAASAVLHLGTLLSVIAYYRADIAWVARGLLGRGDRAARRVAWVIALATLPAAAAGLALGGLLDSFQESATAVGATLAVNGLILVFSPRPASEAGRAMEEAGAGDATAVGLAQAAALLPGISRSGMAIAMGARRGLAPRQAARLAFLMSIPVIAGAGLWEALNISGDGGWGWGLMAGTAAAALSGYGAITLLIKAITRWGMRPFGYYCLAAGLLSLLLI